MARYQRQLAEQPIPGLAPSEPPQQQTNSDPGERASAPRTGPHRATSFRKPQPAPHSPSASSPAASLAPKLTSARKPSQPTRTKGEQRRERNTAQSTAATGPVNTGGAQNEQSVSALLKGLVADPRYREEGRTGKQFRSAVTEGYELAYPGTYQPGSWNRHSQAAVSPETLQNHLQAIFVAEEPAPTPSTKETDRRVVQIAATADDIADTLGFEDWDQRPPQEAEAVKPPSEEPPQGRETIEDVPDTPQSEEPRPNAELDQRLEELQEIWNVRLHDDTEGTMAPTFLESLRDKVESSTGTTPFVPDHQKAEVVSILEDLKDYGDMSMEEKVQLEERIDGLLSDGNSTALHNRLWGIVRGIETRPYDFPASLSDDALEGHLLAAQEVGDVATIAASLGLPAGLLKQLEDGRRKSTGKPNLGGKLGKHPILPFASAFAAVTAKVYRQRVEVLLREYERRHE